TLVLLESAEEQHARRFWAREGLGTRAQPMWDHDDSRTADDRSELVSKRLSVHDESLSAPEPLFEDPGLHGRERAHTQMLHWIMDSEDRSVSAGKRDETRIVVLVNVHDLGSPSRQLSSYRGQPRKRRQRPNAAGDDERR